MVEYDAICDICIIGFGGMDEPEPMHIILSHRFVSKPDQKFLSASLFIIVA